MASGTIMLITGVSSGFGRALAQQALAAGYTVVGTVRSDDARRAFEALSPQAAIGRVLDVTDFERIDRVVADLEASVGPSTCWSTMPATDTKASWRRRRSRSCAGNST